MDNFVCLECYFDFPKSQGILTDNRGHSEFICNPCSTKSACGACGEYNNKEHNCSEENAQ